MKQWFKRWFCNHLYEVEVPWKQPFYSRGIVVWYCTKCNKRINSDFEWEPLNDIVHR